MIPTRLLAGLRRAKLDSCWRPIGLVTLLLALILPASAAGQGTLRVVTSQRAYDAGQTVKVRVLLNSGEFVSHALRIVAAVRYAGSEQNLIHGRLLAESFVLSQAGGSTPNLTVWKIPGDATTGRYEIDLVLRDAASRKTLLNLPNAASFTVYRKLVKIESIGLNKDIYTSNDPVDCRIVLKNLTARPLTHLRVEFSDRYWPWIAGPAAKAAASVVILSKDLTLAPGEERDIASSKVATAPDVKEPSVHQYGVVVWDRGRKEVLDIAFSSLAFVFPPGVDSPRPYPRQYVYPLLKDVNTTAYRHFYPSSLDSGAISFDSSRTMVAPGSTIHVRFSLQNLTSQAWKNVSLVARLLGPDGSGVERTTVARGLVVAPSDAPRKEEVACTLPQGKPGLYREEVSAVDSEGNAVAANVLELGVNPLPKSILIFCAHEDDEGGWMPWIRAAVENHIPIHLVYTTGGDAGSCDTYYEHSCSPEDAINFGALRMDETRAVLGHLGLPPEDIEFLGLPDGGSGEIWYNHHSPSNPFLDPLLACDHAPYSHLVRPNLSYSRGAVVATVEELIKKFDPQVIVTAHPPSEGHIDHIVNGYLAVKALQELVKSGAIAPNQIKVLVDRVYDSKTLPYAPYHYAEHTFYVSGEVAALDQEAEWFYQSQGGDMALGRIRDFNQLRRDVKYREILDWLDYQGWNETRQSTAGKPRKEH
jgi:LmbE family N-acetylglucosaminyl deacetylase